MKNTFFALPLLACAALAPASANAAQPVQVQAAQTDTEVQAYATDERAKAAAEARAGAEAARSEAEAARAAGQHVKVDAEAARRDLEQMREQMRDLSKRMSELSMKLGDVGPRAYAYRYIGDPERGLIGVVPGKDQQGLRVTAVTPGGPADKAGLKNGDVIVAVNGVDLAKGGDAKTSQSLRDLKVGAEVKLVVMRDGKKIDAAMKAERREPFNFAWAFNDQGDVGKLGKLKNLEELKQLGELGDLGAELPPDFDMRIHEQVERATREAERQAERYEITNEQSMRIAERANEKAQNALRKISLAMPWWGLNLANLNPDLGAYFGTDHGVLVLSADADASKTLKSGDVLIAIAGKPVERPEDALRLLREQPGKSVSVEVLRQRKKQTLSMRAPEFKTMFVPAPPAAPIAPVAPTSPTPAAAPRAIPAPSVAPLPRVQPAPVAAPLAPTPPAPPGGPDDSEAPRASTPAGNARIA